MKSFKNAGLNRAQRLKVIGKAHFEFHSQSYGTQNSCSPMFLMLWAQIVLVFLNDFNTLQFLNKQYHESDYMILDFFL